MQRIMSWRLIQPPKGTGYWPSIVRVLLGALILLRLSEVSIPLAAIGQPEILFCAVLWVLAAGCVAAGLFTRTALLLTSFMCFGSYYVYVFQLEPPSFIWFAFASRGSYGEPTNVYFIAVVLLLLAFLPSAEYFSLDAKIRRKPKSQPRPLWAMQLILFQLCAMYFWAATVKLNSSYLSGDALESAWIMSIVGSFYYSHDPSFKPLFQFLSVLVIMAEFGLAFLLFFPRTRKFGMMFGLAFHGIAMMVFPVRYFSSAVAAVYCLFLESPKDDSRV